MSSGTSKKSITYFYEPTVGGNNYGDGHVMKPYRVGIAHDLITAYGLDDFMTIRRPYRADKQVLSQFHSQDYVNLLASAELDPDKYKKKPQFNVGTDDCPVFDGMFDFCQVAAGGSIGAAASLNRQDSHVAINWAGGLHHAKKSEASGFCYINDIVLGILELLKVFKRVLYVDIDIHHGDGVEEAFYNTNRVMTLSFHRFDRYKSNGVAFFPGTGDVTNFGVEEGKYYSVNVPLLPGIGDESFSMLFRTIVSKAVEVYSPEAIVLQSGADSLNGDKLGDFCLSLKGHAECVNYLNKLDIPLMVLGGGGYTTRNVARCWCYETAVIIGEPIPHNLPKTAPCYKYFGSNPTLELDNPRKVKDENSERYLNDIRAQVLQNLSRIELVPSVQFQTTSRVSEAPEEEEEPMEN